MRKEYEKPILEEENIEIEDIVAASFDINDVDIVAPRWGRH